MPPPTSDRPRSVAVVPTARGLAARLATGLKPLARVLGHEQPEASLLLLWPTAWGAILASRALSNAWLWLALVVACAAVHMAVRFASCALVDREMALAHGISRSGAWMHVTALMASALVLVAVCSVLAVQWALMALVLAVLTPWVRRHSYLAQVYVAAVMSSGVLVGFVAITDKAPSAEAWLLWLAAMLWVTASVLWKAMVTRKTDEKEQRKSMAILLGETAIVAQLLILGCGYWALVMLGARAQWDASYYIGLGCALALALWALWQARRREPERDLRAYRLGLVQAAIVLAALCLAPASTPIAG
ncbi:MAG TPA: UbiA family prenyltransferase [Chiayiivirga sp.]|nr:UbiA family prenyltransferase [Chiayiivirga sp.]